MITVVKRRKFAFFYLYERRPLIGYRLQTK